MLTHLEINTYILYTLCTRTGLQNKLNKVEQRVLYPNTKNVYVWGRQVRV